MAKYISVLLIAFAVSVAGCESLDPSPDAGLLELDSGVIFSLVTEQTGCISGGGCTATLWMRTDTIYPCINWTIESSVSKRPGEMLVDFLGIHVPGICATALGPARSSLELDISDRDFVLKFRNEDQIDSYSVSVTDTALVLTEIVSTFTTLE